MPRTAEEILQAQLGAMSMQIAVLTARLEAVTEELDKLKKDKK